MNKPLTYLVAAIVLLSALASAGPTLIDLTHAAVPLVVVVGIVVALVRLVFFHTRNW
jgi:hypothetical protein